MTKERRKKPRLTQHEVDLEKTRWGVLKAAVIGGCCLLALPLLRPLVEALAGRTTTAVVDLKLGVNVAATSAFGVTYVRLRTHKRRWAAELARNEELNQTIVDLKADLKSARRTIRGLENRHVPTQPDASQRLAKKPVLLDGETDVRAAGGRGKR